MKRGYSFKYNLVLVLFLLFLILFLIIFFYKINSNENIDSTSKLWISYDLSVSQLKNNLDIVMDYSADDLTCGNLKGVSFEDGSYENALNNLGCYITLYYYNLIEYDENYHNYLIKYKDKQSISKNDFISLKHDLKNDATFYSYLKNILNFKIDDDKSAENLNNIVSLFLDKFDVSFYDNCKNYTELFSLKISELSLVTYMSYWLKNEYFNLEL